MFCILRYKFIVGFFRIRKRKIILLQIMKLFYLKNTKNTYIITDFVQLDFFFLEINYIDR